MSRRLKKFSVFLSLLVAGEASRALGAVPEPGPGFAGQDESQNGDRRERNEVSAAAVAAWHQNPNMRTEFAMYASIFGNYRNEENGIEKRLAPLVKFDVDRFLFTDSMTIGDIPGWTVVHIPIGEGVNGIPASRVRIKELKFKGHALIQHYRFRIHVDTSARSIHNLAAALNNGLLDYVKCNPSKALFVRKHLARKTIQQEVNVLKTRPGLQPRSPLDTWDAFLKPRYATLNTVQLTENNMFVLDTLHEEFVHQWASIYDTLIERGLWRDQIVYSYVMADMQHKVEHIDPNAKMTCAKYQRDDDRRTSLA